MFFDSNGVRIAVLEEPAQGADLGQPVLLLHGFASSARTNWVGPGWTRLLARAGRRVVAPDNRGHGASDKPHDPAAYATALMADDARRLLDHLRIERADVMGYSMGARIAAFLARAVPDRVRSVVFGGLGDHLVDGAGLPPSLGDAMEAPSLDSLTDPVQRMFRRFAEASGNDLQALAACIRGSRQSLTRAEIGAIACPALVAVGTADRIAGDPHRLAAMLPRGAAFAIEGRDHNPAVGDKTFMNAVLEFLATRP